MAQPLRCASRILSFTCAILVVGALFFWCARVAELPDPGGGEQADGRGFVSVDWDAWLARNPDVAGWINIPGTNISYPVMRARSHDPQFYLHHDVDGAWSFTGVPYLDASCDGDLLTSSNAVIFGHHIPGTMFSALASYSDATFAAAHTTVCLQTPQRKSVWRVFAADVIDAASAVEYTRFGSGEDFAAWRDGVYGDSDVRLERPRCNQVVTLVTCSYRRWANERTVVYAQPDGPDVN